MSKNKNKSNSGNNQFLDVNPQILNMPKITQAVINTMYETSISTPVQTGVGNSGSMAWVMEILKIYVYATAPNVVAGSAVSVSVSLNKKSAPTGTSFPSFEDANVIMQLVRQLDTAAAGTPGVMSDAILVQDLTDASGNGILFGGKTLFMQLTSAACAAGQFKTASMKILYRMKIVNANELLGIMSE